MNTWVYIVFVLFVLAQLWMFFRDRRMLLVKIGSSIVLLGMIALLSASFSSWLGWPAGKPKPGVKYAVLAVDIREPQPDKAGHIYVWLSNEIAQSSLNPFSRPEDAGSPRAFEIAFTPPTEKTMQRAAQAVRQGQSVSAIFGDDEGLEGESDGAEGDPGRGIGGPQHLRGRAGSAPKLFVDEPSSSPIAKK